MVGPKVVVYGLCTEGYDLACTMVLKGAQVHVVDESNQSAMLLTQDIAKTYPNISSIKDDEMILPLVPIKEAVSKAQYIFFSPRIRKAGQDLRTEIHVKFKGATSEIAKNTSIVYCIPAGIEARKQAGIISSEQSFIDDIFGYVFAISCVSNMADWFDSSTTCT